MSYQHTLLCMRGMQDNKLQTLFVLYLILILIYFRTILIIYVPHETLDLQFSFSVLPAFPFLLPADLAPDFASSTQLSFLDQTWFSCALAPHCPTFCKQLRGESCRTGNVRYPGTLARGLSLSLSLSNINLGHVTPEHFSVANNWSMIEKYAKGLSLSLSKYKIGKSYPGTCYPGTCNPGH